jgi:hypothetical protein
LLDSLAVHGYAGRVSGFYFYFYVQSGTWHYYFSGAWTRQPDLLYTAFLPGYDQWTAGLFFLPVVPRALAAAVTLALCSLAAVLLFSQLERLVETWLRRREMRGDEARLRHITMTIAAFVAFVTFYSFAGAPTLRLVPWLHQLFHILVVATATLFLARRLLRTPQAFTEETVGLAPAPRSATVCAGANGTRILRLHGNAFREVMNAHPAMTSEVIRLLAHRLHGHIGGGEPCCMPSGAIRNEGTQRP